MSRPRLSLVVCTCCVRNWSMAMLDARRNFVLRGTTNLKSAGIRSKMVNPKNVMNWMNTTSDKDNQKGQNKLARGISIDVQAAKRVVAYP